MLCVRKTLIFLLTQDHHWIVSSKSFGLKVFWVSLWGQMYKLFCLSFSIFLPPSPQVFRDTGRHLPAVPASTHQGAQLLTSQWCPTTSCLRICCRTTPTCTDTVTPGSWPGTTGCPTCWLKSSSMTLMWVDQTARVFSDGCSNRACSGGQDSKWYTLYGQMYVDTWSGFNMPLWKPALWDAGSVHLKGLGWGWVQGSVRTSSSKPNWENRFYVHGSISMLKQEMDNNCFCPFFGDDRVWPKPWESAPDQKSTEPCEPHTLTTHR